MNENSKAIEYTIMGYLRENESELDQIIPKSLKLMIAMFYPNVVKYRGKFLSSNAGPGVNIEADNLRFTGYRSAKLNNPLPVEISSDMITSIRYQWKAKATSDSRITRFLTSYFFGVVSNRCKKFGEYPYGELQDSYGLSMEENVVYLNSKKIDKNYLDKIKFGDLIVIEYEINKHLGPKLYFYKQDNLVNFVNDDNSMILIYTMDLPKDEEITNWYPVFSKPGYMDSYIVVVPSVYC